MAHQRILRSDALFLCLGAAAFAAFSLRFWTVSLDDVFISFRYAENLVHGHGLVYNPQERIEGYSNLLYTLLLAPIAALGAPLLAAAKALNLLAGLGVLLLHAVWPGASGFVRRTTVLALAGSAGLALWAAIGLETVVYVFLLQAATFLLVRSGITGRGLRAAGLCFGLAAVTRPEGAVFFVPALLVLRRRGVPGRRALPALLLFAAPVLLQLAFRLLYYGSPLPQTFYTKVGFDPSMSLHGFRYLFVSFVLSYLTPLGLLVLWPRLRAWARGGPVGETAFLFWGMLIAAGLFVVGVGWDWMPGYRLLLPALPGGLWLLARGLEDALGRVPGGSRRRHLAVAGTLLVVGVLALSTRKATQEVRPYWRRSWYAAPSLRWEEWVEPDRLAVARWIRAHAEPGDWLATGEAGFVPWYTRLRVIDTWGLMNPVVGAMVRPMRPGAMVRYRESGPYHPIAEYVLSRRPAFVLTDVQEVEPPDAMTLFDGAYVRAFHGGRFLVFTRADPGP
jgi:hypothetical protein